MQSVGTMHQHLTHDDNDDDDDGDVMLMRRSNENAEIGNRSLVA